VTAVLEPVTIEAGASYTESWEYRDPAPAGQDPNTGAPIALDTWRATYVIRTKETTPVLSFSSTDPELTVVGAVVILALKPVDTAKLPFKPYVSSPDGSATCHYTLAVTDPTGNVVYLVTGPIIVNGP
jgi:hypothetical protein